MPDKTESSEQVVWQQKRILKKEKKKQLATLISRMDVAQTN